MLDFFSRAIRPGDTVVDIGSYVGAYALLASRLVGTSGRVYALEPNPESRRVLMRNVAANRAANVTVLPYAVGATSGYGSLRQERLTETQVIPGAKGAPGAVRMVTLVDFCEELAVAPAVIKIDVEGAEADVLSDASAGVVAKTRAVIVELHDDGLRERGSSRDELMSRVTTWGGRVVTIDEKPGNGHIALLAHADQSP